MYLFFIIFILFSTGIRTVLLLKMLPDIDLNWVVMSKSYAVGFFYDSVTFFYFSIPLVLYLTFLPDRILKNACHRAFLYLLFFVVVSLLFFDSVAEYLFFEEFGARFNFIAVDYLIYTREVVGNIRESYPVFRILGAIFIASALVFGSIKKYIELHVKSHSTFKQRVKTGIIFLIVPVLSFVFVDQSFSHISGNGYINELSENGMYDLFAAFRNNELDYDTFYAAKDAAFVSERLKSLEKEKNAKFIAGDLFSDISRAIHDSAPEKKMNVLVVVEESLSAEYLKAFGSHKGLTPNLDKLAEESLLFTRLYATGTRTVRGLEAITLSFPPLPGTSLIKRPHNENFFSWGSLMREKGYDNKFIYGGYGYFDNMDSFFSKNGFGIVDRSSFGNNEVTFSNIWGVCDEDLFRKVVSEANESYKSNKPFFSVIMTTSNHRPFTYPEGKIDIPSHSGREGGVKYADYAIGRFMEDARRQPWFKDTVIVIGADHCASSAGMTELPVKKYEIPLLVYAPAYVKPQKVDTMASQIDIAPTILGLLHFSYTSKLLGKDILKMDEAQERAFISNYQKLGFLKDDRLVILEPKKQVKLYEFSREDGREQEIPAEDDYISDAISYYQGAAYIYRHKLNRM